MEVNMTKALNTAGKIVLTGTIAASRVAQYGLTFATGLTKTLYGGALKMANSFAPVNVNLGVGEYLLNQAEKLTNKAFDGLVNLQKHIRNKL